MKIISSAFQSEESIPVKYTCEGEGINPPLSFIQVPQGTQSLALIVDDPDAPSGTFTHWLIWSIPPETVAIPENTVPLHSVQGINGTGELGWIAPCPPTGQHRYRFKLYAISQLVTLPEGADQAAVEKIINTVLIEKAELIGTYQKQSS